MDHTISPDSHNSSQLPSSHVTVGRIIGTWGLKGHLKVDLLTDVQERFAPGSLLYLDGDPVTVVSSAQRKGHRLVLLDAVRDRTRAEKLRGHSLTIPEDRVAPLPEDTYYHFQILDMDVWSDEEVYVGKVEEILTTGGNDVYIIRDRDSGHENLIPAVAEFVLNVDTVEGKMTIHLPEQV